MSEHRNDNVSGHSSSPLVEVWSIAWPTVLTMTSYTVMQFVDKLMVADVGPTQVAAQGNGGIWAFTPIAFAMGALTVVNTYVAQNLGAGKPKEGPKYAWAAIWMAIALWLIVLLPYALLLPNLFALMGHSTDLTHLETGYGQILLLGAVVLIASRGVHHYFFGLHRPKIVTISALLSNTVNIFANYVLIFGKFGAPELGLYGAAIGTVMGTMVEFAIPFCVLIGPRMHAELRTRAAWRPQWEPIRDLLRIGWPASVQFGNEILCWSIFMTILVGKFGEEHMTAGWATLGYMHLSFMPAVGFSVAVTSLVGKYIGAGQPDIAAARARLGLGMAMAYMTVFGLIFFFFREPLIGFFVSQQSTTPEEATAIISIGAKLMICAAVFQTVDAFGIVYSGALRGAGDTVWPGIITIIYSWLFIVGGGWLISEWKPEWESVGPWIGASVYIIALGITMSVRFERGRWRSLDLLSRDDQSRSAANVAPISPGPPAPSADASIRDLAESEQRREGGASS